MPDSKFCVKCVTFKWKLWLTNRYNLKSLYIAYFLWKGTNSTFPFMQLHMWACIHHFFHNCSCTTAFLIIYFTFRWKWLVIRNIHSLSSIPVLMHRSTLLSRRSACRCQERKVVEPEESHGSAQLSDVASAKERRARWVCCVILTCSSAMLHNPSSVECLYSCFLSSGAPWGVSTGNRFPATTTLLCICGSRGSEAVYRNECYEIPFWSSYKPQYLYVCMLCVGTCLALTLRWSISCFHVLGRGVGRIVILSVVLHSQPSVLEEGCGLYLQLMSTSDLWNELQQNSLLFFVLYHGFSPLRTTISHVISSLYFGVFF